MNHMWTRSKTASDEVILSKLVELARGDVALVNQAIRATRQDDAPVDLAAIVSYITEHTKKRPAMKVPAPAFAN